MQFPQLGSLMGKLTEECCCTHGTVCAGNEAARKQMIHLSFIASKYGLHLVHPGQSAAHAAKRLGHHGCQSSAVALPLPQQCHQHRLWLGCGIAGAKEVELQVSARERPLCSPWGRERCADALGAVGLAVFSSSLIPSQRLHCRFMLS